MASFACDAGGVINKFNGRNLNLSKFKIKMFLAAMDLWNIVDGSKDATPSIAEPKVLKYYQ